MTQPASTGVVLPRGHTGSSLFHAVLSEAAARFPAALGRAGLPADAHAFKRVYRESLPRFEAERAAAPERVEIARFIVRRTQEALLYADERGSIALSEHLASKASEPARLQSRAFQGSPGLRAEIPLDGKLYRGRDILELSERLALEQGLTDAARSALCWIVEHFEERGGVLDLRGERFAMLGAGAELAPTRLLLKAGASVLWIDLAEPERVLGDGSELAGELVQSASARDLLQAPRAVVDAVTRFAGDQAVHLGLFAYASGASREWRLGASMNAIAASLQPALVRSVSMLVSPTTAAHVQPESARAAQERSRRAPLWQAALRSVGVLRAGGYHEQQSIRVAHAAVSIQGLSYQAAQYISKLAAAETFAVHGTDLHGTTQQPTTVSANIAGITRTRSLQHALFQAAFIGAPRFGVRIFEPATTRALNGLLILHDLLNPSAAGAAKVQADDARDKATRLLSQQVHGGIYSLPYALESAIRVAAVIGMGSSPSVLLSALRQGTRAAAAGASSSEPVVTGAGTASPQQ